MAIFSDLVRTSRNLFDRRRPELRFFDMAKARRIHPNIRLTCRGRTDGGGAQAHGAYSALAFAAASGIGYAHSPFREIEHGKDDPQWTRRWEDFFAIGLGERAVDETHDRLVPLRQFVENPDHHQAADVVVTHGHFHNFCDDHLACYDDVLPDFRRKYRASDKSGLARYDHPGRLSIAVHLRRGDVTAESHSERFTEDGVILRTLDEIAAVCRDLNLAYRVDLYSSGDAASFTTFRAHRANLHVNDDVFASFDNLVRADVLMMAKSSFSYVAGMLSEGIKLYEPFWHPPLAPWIVRAPDGGFDRTRLADALIRLRSGGALGD